jgi:hypothetical protein
MSLSFVMTHLGLVGQPTQLLFKSTLAATAPIPAMEAPQRAERIESTQPPRLSSRIFFDHATQDQ